MIYMALYGCTCPPPNGRGMNGSLARGAELLGLLLHDAVVHLRCRQSEDLYTWSGLGLGHTTANGTHPSGDSQGSKGSRRLTQVRARSPKGHIGPAHRVTSRRVTRTHARWGGDSRSTSDLFDHFCHSLTG